jgi:hypothetical protein
VKLLWLAGSLVLTASAYAAAIGFGPAAGAAPGRGLALLLFTGTSVHVASTAWFFSIAEVRDHARRRRARYLVAPTALIIGTAVVAGVLSEAQFSWLLLAFFAWQFFHFQKQNLGLAALAAVSSGASTLTNTERRTITASGIAGIGALLARPELLELHVDPPLRWLYPTSVVLFAGVLATGLALLARRARRDRPPPFVAVYGASLVFFLPALAFDAPFAAVAGLTIAHGLQYLLLVALVAGGEREPRRRAISLGVLFNIAFLGGVALSAASHLHAGGSPSRAVFGAYLGVVMAHFVIDAGLWRLRDPFPRELLGERLPFLLDAAP